MIDFSEVMRQWRRMCDTMSAKYRDNPCKYCPLDNVVDNGCDAIFAMDIATDYNEIAEIVMKWAKENPELEYPTWGDWIVEMGLAKWVDEDDPFSATLRPTFKMCTKIPADIAEKLGIKPKNELFL